MQINTKYNIGQRIWVVYENETSHGYSGEVNVYDTEITGIYIDKDGISYETTEGMIELKEDDVILYNDNDKLLFKIKELMKKIHEREEKENDKNK